MLDTKDIIGWGKKPRENDCEWDNNLERERRRKHAL